MTGTYAQRAPIGAGILPQILGVNGLSLTVRNAHAVQVAASTEVICLQWLLVEAGINGSARRTLPLFRVTWPTL